MVKSELGLSKIEWKKRRVRAAGGRILEAVGVGRIKGSVTTDEGKNINLVFSDVLAARPKFRQESPFGLENR